MMDEKLKLVETKRGQIYSTVAYHCHAYSSEKIDNYNAIISITTLSVVVFIFMGLEFLGKYKLNENPFIVPKITDKFLPYMFFFTRLNHFLTKNKADSVLISNSMNFHKSIIRKHIGYSAVFASTMIQEIVTAWK